MKVKIFGDSGSDTETQYHEPESEVSDTEVAFTYPVISSSNSLSSPPNTGTTLIPKTNTSPTSVMLATLTTFMKDEFSKLHARIDHIRNQRSSAMSTASVLARLDTQWMQQIDDRSDGLQTDVVELKSQFESLKNPTIVQELILITNLTAQLRQLSEQVQQSQQTITKVQLPSSWGFAEKPQAPNVGTHFTDTGVSSPATQISAQSSACGPNFGYKIREKIASIQKLRSQLNLIDVTSEADRVHEIEFST